MHTYLASEIYSGTKNLVLIRDYIVTTINTLCNAVECSKSGPAKFRASHCGYEWHVEYKSTENGKSWSILCYKQVNNGLNLVFSRASEILSDEYACGICLTMDELTSLFLSTFPEINRRLEILKDASTIRIPQVGRVY